MSAMSALACEANSNGGLGPIDTGGAIVISVGIICIMVVIVAIYYFITR